MRCCSILLFVGMLSGCSSSSGGPYNGKNAPDHPGCEACVDQYDHAIPDAGTCCAAFGDSGSPTPNFCAATPACIYMH